MCTQASELRAAPIRSDTGCMEHDTCRGVGVTSCGTTTAPPCSLLQGAQGILPTPYQVQKCRQKEIFL